jgi:hypothetical protein
MEQAGVLLRTLGSRSEVPGSQGGVDHLAQDCPIAGAGHSQSQPVPLGVRVAAHLRQQRRQVDLSHAQSWAQFERALIAPQGSFLITLCFPDPPQIVLRRRRVWVQRYCPRKAELRVGIPALFSESAPYSEMERRPVLIR